MFNFSKALDHKRHTIYRMLFPMRYAPSINSDPVVRNAKSANITNN